MSDGGGAKKTPSPECQGHGHHERQELNREPRGHDSILGGAKVRWMRRWYKWMCASDFPHLRVVIAMNEMNDEGTNE